MADAASEVVSGLLCGDIRLVDETAQALTPEHFIDPTLKSLFRSILTYRSVAGGVLTAEALESIAAGSDAGTAALLRESFDALVAQAATPDQVRWSSHLLRKEHEQRLTAAALRDASDILTGSITEEGPNGSRGRTWAGPTDAREWMAARVAEINSETQVFEAPASDVFGEGRTIIEEYIKARDEDKSRRPQTGIPAFDDLTGGLGKGLIIVAGSSGFGKTQFCVSLAYHASQMQGLHVFFATSETVRSTVRARLIARHSRHEKFADDREAYGLPLGLDSQKIDRGTLAEEHVPFLARIAVDWGATGDRPEGSCYVAQMPHGQTMMGLRSQIDTRSRVVMPDLVIIDYIALMSSLKRHGSSREELSSIVKEAAHFAVDYNKGNGVPTVSPWQLNRESQKELVRTGVLDTSGLAETAEAVNSAHLVAALTPDGARDGRLAGLKLNVLKHRDGQQLLGDSAIPLQVDYATSYFSSRVGATVANDGAVDNELFGLIGA